MNNYSKIIDILKDVNEWLNTLPITKEESVTDFLQFRIQKDLNNVTFIQFNRHEESHEKWADFDLILILDKETWSFRIQAKKLSSRWNYIKLNHNKWKQIDLLLSSSKKDNRIPLYAFYYISKSSSACWKKANAPVSILSWTNIKHKFTTIPRKWAKWDALYKISLPFSCLFCCDLIKKNSFEYFLKHYSKAPYQIFHEDDIELGKSTGETSILKDIKNYKKNWELSQSLLKISKSVNAVIVVDFSKKD